MTDRSLQRWAHLHRTELGNGEFEVLPGLRPILRVLLEDELGEL